MEFGGGEVVTNVMPQITPEALVKGRLAEHLVELLLTDAGYKVVRISQEGLLINISREDAVLNKSKAAGRLTTAPSFAVFDRKGVQVALIKVKFRGAESSGRNVAHGIAQLLAYWPEAELVIVSPEAPNFRRVQVDQLEESIDALFPRVKKTALSGFGRLVEKFLGQ